MTAGVYESIHQPANQIRGQEKKNAKKKHSRRMASRQDTTGGVHKSIRQPAKHVLNWASEKAKENTPRRTAFS